MDYVMAATAAKTHQFLQWIKSYSVVYLVQKLLKETDYLERQSHLCTNLEFSLLKPAIP